jgi:hypothetical protein
MNQEILLQLGKGERRINMGIASSLATTRRHVFSGRDKIKEGHMSDNTTEIMHQLTGI